MTEILNSLGEMTRFANRIKNTHPHLVSKKVGSQIHQAFKLLSSNSVDSDVIVQSSLPSKALDYPISQVVYFTYCKNMKGKDENGNSLTYYQDYKVVLKGVIIANFPPTNILKVKMFGNGFDYQEKEGKIIHVQYGNLLIVQDPLIIEAVDLSLIHI